MQLTLKDGLPFATVEVFYHGVSVEIQDVLIDTGSASTIFSADILASINVAPLPTDTLHLIRGVGGTEAVFMRRMDQIRLGEKLMDGVEVEVGGMDYGFEISGILGMDLLLAAGATIDLPQMRIIFDNGEGVEEMKDGD